MIRDVFLSDAGAFMKSRVILTAAELDLFTLLEDRPSGVSALAETAGLDPRATERILDCLVTFDLLRKEGASFHVTDTGSMLSSRHPESIRPMVLHQNHMWDNWNRLTESVRQGANTQRIRASEQRGATLEAFVGAMHVIGEAMAKEIASGYDAQRFRRLLDVGGATGTYTIAFLERNPDLEATLFDLPEVTELARPRLDEKGLAGRVTLAPGNFYQDELPTGADLVLLSAIIHQNSPQQNLELYQKVNRALEPGGTILIRDHIMDEDRSKPPLGALFALNMLVGTDGGDTYTLPEVEEKLAEAGFNEVRLIRKGEHMDCLVEAIKPAV
jgi:SAM-dependent methyltransferase